MSSVEAVRAGSLSSGSNQSENVLSLVGHLDPALTHTVLKMDDGTSLYLDTAVLTRALESRNQSEAFGSDTSDSLESDVVIPLVEEQLEVGKLTKTTGKVRLQKSTQTYTQALDETLAIRTFEVERVVLNRPVDTAPPARQEGNVTIYSLVEEQLVLTKQLILTEEIHVVQRDTERQDTQVVTLQKEHLTVERETLN